MRPLPSAGLPLVIALVVACGGTEPPAGAPPAVVAPSAAVDGSAEPAGASTPAAIPAVSWRVPERRATSPAAVARDPAVIGARNLLRDKVVDRYARDPANPWAVAHAMLAFGADHELTNGRSAIDFLLEEYAEPFEVGGEVLLRFPERRGTIRIEPHTDLVLKALTEQGATPDRPVRVGGRAFTLGDLYRGSLARAWVDGAATGFQSWNDTPWALQALAAWAPRDLAWTAAGGHAMTMDAFTSAVVAKLASETAFLQTHMRAGIDFEKRKQGIFAYTCGGAHLLQGAAFAVARGFGTDDDRARIAAQVPLMFYRYPIELAITDRMLAVNPDARGVLLVQRLKFTGHFLESMHKLAAAGLFVPSPEQRELLDKATGDLVATIMVLEKLGVFGKLEEIRAQDEQAYLDIVGDAAHAVRALDLALGEGTVLY